MKIGTNIFLLKHQCLATTSRNPKPKPKKNPNQQPHHEPQPTHSTNPLNPPDRNKISEKLKKFPPQSQKNQPKLPDPKQENINMNAKKYHGHEHHRQDIKQEKCDNKPRTFHQAHLPIQSSFCRDPEPTKNENHLKIMFQQYLGQKTLTPPTHSPNSSNTDKYLQLQTIIQILLREKYPPILIQIGKRMGQVESDWVDSKNRKWKFCYYYC